MGRKLFFTALFFSLVSTLVSAKDSKDLAYQEINQLKLEKCIWKRSTLYTMDRCAWCKIQERIFVYPQYSNVINCSADWNKCPKDKTKDGLPM